MKIGNYEYTKAGTIVSAAAPAQWAVVFCLQPETFDTFVTWLKRNHSMPPEWFDPEEIRRDLEQSLHWITHLLEAQQASRNG